MKVISKFIIFIISILASLSSSMAYAGLFSDNEARQAILDVRKEISNIHTSLDAKADNLSSLNLSEREDQLEEEIAGLRGTLEVIGNKMMVTRAGQKDLYRILETRLRRLESNQINTSGERVRTFSRKIYDAALANFQSGKYKEAAFALSNFLEFHLDSSLEPSAQYWLGCSYYALGDYGGAIAAQDAFVKKYPGDDKAPEALLNMALSYTETENKPRSQEVLRRLVEKYPNTKAAQLAKENIFLERSKPDGD